MDFRQFLEKQNLNDKTIETHIRNLTNYGKVGESQRIIINKLNENETWGRRLSRANTLSKYLQFKNLPNDEIVEDVEINIGGDLDLGGQLDMPPPPPPAAVTAAVVGMRTRSSPPPWRLWNARAWRHRN